MIIGICGGSASGKSTFTRKLIDAVGEDRVTHLEHDAYFLNIDNLPPHLKHTHNFDHPDALDNPLFLRHLHSLVIDRKPIDLPVYDFSTHRRTAETFRISPKPVIVVVGLLLFALEEVRKYFDIKVYIDADDDIRLARRLKRDVIERGRQSDFVIHQYIQNVRPMHKKFVEPGKQFADLIIRGDIDNRVGVDLLATKIDHYLNSAHPKANGRKRCYDNSGMRII